MNIKKLAATLGVAAAALMPIAASAAPSTVVVTPANQQGWYVADQRAGGELHFITDATSPYPTGALQLKTDLNTASKMQYLHNTTTPLADVTELSYNTKQVSGPPEAAASYQLAVDLNGSAAGGFTTLVYEPYWNGAVVPTVWQNWDVDSGQFWSSRTFTDGTCSVVNGAGGPPFYTLASLKAACPDAVVGAFGVNVGTFNLAYNVETDGFNFNGTTYDFQVTNEPNSKDQCKDGGFGNFTDADGNSFKNQGQCVSYTQHNNGKGNDDNKVSAPVATPVPTVGTAAFNKALASFIK